MASGTMQIDRGLKTQSSSGYNNDFDNLPNETAVWINNGGGTWTHAPANTSFHVLTLHTLSTHGVQIAVQWTGASMYIRTRADNAWREWKMVSLS